MIFKDSELQILLCIGGLESHHKVSGVVKHKSAFEYRIMLYLVLVHFHLVPHPQYSKPEVVVLNEARKAHEE